MDRKTIPGGEPVVRRVSSAGAETPAPPEKPGTGTPKPPRKKVTPEDIEAAFARRRAERAQRNERKAERPPREMGKLVRGVSAAAMGLCIVAGSLAINHAAGEHRTAVAANESRIAALTGALEELAPDDSRAESAEAIAGNLAAARKRGDELAAAQQQFAVISHAGNTEPGNNDGTPKTSVMESLEQRRQLAGFFDPDSLVLTDEQAYTFRTEDLLDPGRIDPRQPWYLRYDGTGGLTASAPESYGWSTASVSLSGTPDVVEVVWTNTETETGELLAWATARYSVKTGTFDTLRVNTTTQGDSHRLKADEKRSTPTGEGTA